MQGNGMKRLGTIFFWLPALLWYRVIWGFSAQTAAVSGDLSDRLLWRLMDALSPAFRAVDAETQNAAVELLSYFERKAAHMFLYFVLALLVYFAAARLAKEKNLKMVLTLLACAALAGLDELHQRYVPGRSGQLKDVAIDLAGVGAALLLLGVIFWIARCRTGGRRETWVWIPAALCVILAALAAFYPGDLTGLPPFAWAAERFIPGFTELDPGGQAELLAGLAPILREVLYLACCALVGCGAVMTAALGGLSLPRSLWTCPVAGGLLGGGLAVLSGITAAGWSVGFAALGALVALALWLACLIWTVWAGQNNKTGPA